MQNTDAVTPVNKTIHVGDILQHISEKVTQAFGNDAVLLNDKCRKTRDLFYKLSIPRGKPKENPDVRFAISLGMGHCAWPAGHARMI